MTEQNLDPQDWNAMRALGHQMLDDMFDYVENVRERPVWQPTNAEVHDFLNQPLPEAPTSAEQIYADFQQYILPYNKGTITPRFWSWVQGSGTILGMLGDMLASGMNPNVTIGDHAAMYVDAQVMDWCKSLMDFPETAGGMLVSGGSIANITALITARNVMTEQLVRKSGVQALSQKLVMYASKETHSSQQKAAEIMGFGKEGLKLISTNEQFQMDMNALRQQIEADLAAGLKPFCIVGNAGTVGTGATDDLNAIADLCAELGLWFHIDGAFGAIPYILPEFREGALKGLNRADSVAFDLHKWMYVNYEVGCFLIRDRAQLRASFEITPPYLIAHERGLASGLDSFNNYGMELSRGFKALKVWMSFREHGIEKYRQLVRQNIEQVQYLVAKINEAPALEMLAPAPMNIACFRFNPNDGIERDLNALNKEILMQLHEKAIALPSYNILNGQYAIRVAHTNHRSTRADFDDLVAGVVEIGNQLINP